MSSPVGSTATSDRDAGICSWGCSSPCRRCWRSRSWLPWTTGGITGPTCRGGAALLGYALLLVGFAGLTWAQSVNKFFEPSVRIQTDRGHKVIDTGPYAIVRHPGYAFGFLFFLGMPLALGSLWASDPCHPVCPLLVVRTILGGSNAPGTSCRGTRNTPSESDTGWFLGSGDRADPSSLI